MGDPPPITELLLELGTPEWGQVQVRAFPVFGDQLHTSYERGDSYEAPVARATAAECRMLSDELLEMARLLDITADSEDEWGEDW